MAKNWKTKLIHPDAHAPEGFSSLALATYRGSTVLFPNAAAVQDTWDQHAVGSLTVSTARQPRSEEKR